MPPEPPGASSGGSSGAASSSEESMLLYRPLSPPGYTRRLAGQRARNLRVVGSVPPTPRPSGSQYEYSCAHFKLGQQAHTITNCEVILRFTSLRAFTVF
eukprot:scaffold10248_cov65-Phaeocystis_antarctica.AAC.10